MLGRDAGFSIPHYKRINRTRLWRKEKWGHWQHGSVGKVLGTDILSSVSWTQRFEGENHLQEIFLWPPHVWNDTCAHAHTHTLTHTLMCKHTLVLIFVCVLTNKDCLNINETEQSSTKNFLPLLNLRTKWGLLSVWIFTLNRDWDLASLNR